MRTQFSVCRFPLPRCLVFLFALCLLWAQDRPARAQNSNVSVMFQPDTRTGMQGDTLNYTGIFTNNTAMDLLINNATFNSTNADFFTTYGNYGFFNGNGVGDGSFTLAANSIMTFMDVVSINLITPMDIPPGGTFTPTPAGTYDIDATFTQDSSNGGTGVPIVTGPLHVVVTEAGSPTPEFGSVWSLGGLLLAGGMGAWWQMRRRAPIAVRESSPAS